MRVLKKLRSLAYIAFGIRYGNIRLFPYVEPWLNSLYYSRLKSIKNFLLKQFVRKIDFPSSITIVAPSRISGHLFSYFFIFEVLLNVG